MSERQQKALAIAAKNKLTKKGDTWIVPSQSSNDYYKVNANDPDWPTCTCPDFELRHARCKHIYAVEYTIERETKTKRTKTDKGETVTTTVTETVKIRYKQEVSYLLCKCLLPHASIKRLAVGKVRQERIYTPTQFFHQIV